VPDFFGNPATLNYWGVWNYGELAGYIGIVPLFFALYAIVSNKSKNTLFFLLTVLISLLFALPTFFAQLPLTLHILFLATAQPTRLMVFIDFSLTVLAAIGLNEFLQHRKRIYIPAAIFLLVFAGIWAVLILHTKLLPLVSLTNISVARHNVVLPTSIFIIMLIFIFVSISLRKNRIVVLGCVSCLFVLSCFDSLRFADKFTPFTNSGYLYPSTKTIQFLQQNIGNYRYMTTDSQILPPNFSIMYHVQSVDGYDPLYIKEYGELIVAMERGKPDIHEPFGFNRILTPHNYSSRLMDLLGVKYILSLSDIQNPTLKNVSNEGQTKVYENLHVFQRAFFVKGIIETSNDQQAVNFLFDIKNNLQSSASVINVDKIRQNLQVGFATIQSYTDTHVTLQTKNTGNGFLVLTDAYYPTWHVYVDGKETKIYRTDLAFRGVFVTAGDHIIEFRDGLF